MAHGEKASNPETPYVVYEFLVKGRVCYIGIGQQGSTRATDRWNYVSRQLERLDKEGALPTGKMADIRKTSGAVIAAMIRQGIERHAIDYPWEGFGRQAALAAERAQIERRLSEGCVLANVDGNPKPATTDEVLAYLGFDFRDP